MSHANKLDKFLMSFNNTMAWGKVERNEAVHTAIDHAFPELKQVEKADLYAKVIEGFDQYDGTRMVSRRMWLGSLLNSWFSDRVSRNFMVLRGKGPSQQEQQQMVATGGFDPKAAVDALKKEGDNG